MKRRRRPASIRRNMTLILLAVLLCAALMLAVRWFNNPTPRLLGRDYDAINAQRNAPENALHAMLRASAALPGDHRPTYIIRQCFYGRQHARERESQTARSLLLDYHVADIPEDMLAFFQGYDAALTEFHSALEQPYFLEYSPPVLLRRMPSVDKCMSMIIYITLYAAYMGRVRQQTDEMIPLLTDIIRMRRKMAPEYFCNGQFFNPVTDPTLQFFLMARQASSPKTLENMQQALEQLGPPYPNPAAMLEYVWEKFDITFLYPDPVERTRFIRRLEYLFMYRQLDQSIRHFAEEKDLWMERVRMTPAQLTKELPPSLPRRVSRYEIFREPWLAVLDLVERMAVETSTYHAARLAIALERFKLAREHYPEALAELVPEYLPALPVDAINGLDFGYETEGIGYWIFSYGKNGVDGPGKWRVPTNVGDNAWLYEPIPVDMDIMLMPYSPPAPPE